jgi:hypothetical protein
MDDSARLLARELQLVLEGEVSLADVLEDPRHVLGRALTACFHGLQHYLADEDIRTADAEYRRMQEGEMRRLIGLLKEGADDAELRRVHFLGRAHV